MKVLTPREASIFACLVDAVVAPEPPLPAVAATDAVRAFDAWLAHAPGPNRMALRALLLALEAAPRLAGRRRLRQLDRGERRALVQRLERMRALQVSGVADALRSLAGMSYYGDAAVLRVVQDGSLGHRPRPARAPA